MFKVFSRCAGKLFRRNSWRIAIAHWFARKMIRILRKIPPRGLTHPDPTALVVRPKIDSTH